MAADRPPSIGAITRPRRAEPAAPRSAARAPRSGHRAARSAAPRCRPRRPAARRVGPWAPTANSLRRLVATPGRHEQRRGVEPSERLRGLLTARDRGARAVGVDDHRLLVGTRRPLRRGDQRARRRQQQPVRGRREPAGQDRLEPGPIGEVHPVDLRDRAGVLRDPPDLRAVGAEGERGEHRVRLREDEPHGVLPLVVGEPDALALPLVDDEAERQAARVIRDRLVGAGRAASRGARPSRRP